MNRIKEIKREIEKIRTARNTGRRKNGLKRLYLLEAELKAITDKEGVKNDILPYPKG